jgi:hypothetical protein
LHLQKRSVKKKEMFCERKDYGNSGPVRGQSTACEN